MIFHHFSTRLALLALVCPLILSTTATAGTAKPNVLFLFTDDQRSDTIHALGNERIKTPNIDRLVKEGLSFTNAHIMGATSMAVCTPSRACLFSGRTLWNLESQGPWDFAIPDKYKTMAQVFLEDGYTAFATGKNDPGFGKNDHFARSFNVAENLYYRGGHRGQDHTPLFDFTFDKKKPEMIKKPSDGRFNADLFADSCVEFLTGRKDVEEPFLAYVSFMTPHDPLNCPEEYKEMYGAKDMKLPANYLPEHPFDAGIHHIRDEKLMGVPRTEEKVLDRLADYYALVTHTDAQIGRILKALEESGHADNTIIVFSSDNGLALGSHGLMGKQNIYQHAVQVPLIIRGPGISKGETRSQLCYIYDIYPTLCDLAGIAVPETVQYRSLKPTIGNAGATHREDLYFAFMQWHRSVRDERYKLIEYRVDGASHTQLFDLMEDPDETQNLAKEDDMQPTLSRLRALLKRRSEELDEPRAEAPHIRKMAEEFWNTSP